MSEYEPADQPLERNRFLEEPSPGPDLSDYSLPPEPPIPPGAMERQKAPSRLAAEEKKKSRSPLASLLLLGVLIFAALSAVLGTGLVRAQGELAQLRQNMDDLPLVGADISIPEDEPPVPEADDPAPAPEHPAYQDLYPELYAQPVERGSIDKEKTAYLTFDDGPSARTPEVLEILEQYGIKGTFFLVGGDTEQGRQWMQDIVAAGHTIGVHSYTHDYNKIYASVEAFLEDFSLEYHLILDTTGVAPQIFRFPGGSVNAYNGATYKEIISEMVRRGFVYYDWNRQTGDAVKNTPSASVLVKNALTSVDSARRIILLAHDSKRYTNMVEALPSIIEGYQAAGFSLEALTPEVRPIVYDYPG